MTKATQEKSFKVFNKPQKFSLLKNSSMPLNMKSQLSFLSKVKLQVFSYIMTRILVIGA